MSLENKDDNSYLTFKFKDYHLPNSSGTRGNDNNNNNDDDNNDSSNNSNSDISNGSTCNDIIDNHDPGLATRCYVVLWNIMLLTIIIAYYSIV